MRCQRCREPNAGLPSHTARDDNFAEVSVSDTGPGIPSEKIKEVFEPFFTTKAAGHGNGIVHCPNDRRSPQRSDMGREQGRAWRSVSRQSAAISNVTPSRQRRPSLGRRRSGALACPLLGDERTWLGCAPRSAFDPQETFRSRICCDAKCACKSARGPDADRHVKLLIQFAWRGHSRTLIHNEARTHLALDKDAPLSRTVKRAGRILCRPVLGGLHHEYIRI